MIPEMTADFTKYPLPDGLKWQQYNYNIYPSVGIAADGGINTEAWVTLVDGKYLVVARTSSRSSIPPVNSYALTLDEALQYIYTWVMLGMNRSGE